MSACGIACETVVIEDIIIMIVKKQRNWCDWQYWIKIQGIISMFIIKYRIHRLRDARYQSQLCQLLPIYWENHDHPRPIRLACSRRRCSKRRTDSKLWNYTCDHFIFINISVIATMYIYYTKKKFHRFSTFFSLSPTYTMSHSYNSYFKNLYLSSAISTLYNACDSNTPFNYDAGDIILRANITSRLRIIINVHCIENLWI